MRNWPYAYPLMQDSAESRVAGKFSVAPMPAGPGGTHTAAIGGAQLAINRRTEHPEAAWAVIDYLTQPEQMRERARGGGTVSHPVRLSTTIPSSHPGSPSRLPRCAASSSTRVPRPVTPVYTQLSEILQIHLHRALTRQIGAGRGPGPGPSRDAAAAEPRRTRHGRAGCPALIVGPASSSRRLALPGRWSFPHSSPSCSSRCFRWSGRVWESLHLHDLRMPWLGQPFVGLDNYVEALRDPRFWGVARVTRHSSP